MHTASPPLRLVAKPTSHRLAKKPPSADAATVLLRQPANALIGRGQRRAAYEGACGMPRLPLPADGLMAGVDCAPARCRRTAGGPTRMDKPAITLACYAHDRMCAADSEAQ